MNKKSTSSVDHAIRIVALHLLLDCTALGVGQLAVIIKHGDGERQVICDEIQFKNGDSAILINPVDQISDDVVDCMQTDG